MLTRSLLVLLLVAGVCSQPSSARAESPFWKCLPSYVIIPMTRTIADSYSPQTLSGTIAHASFRLRDSGAAYTLSSTALPSPLTVAKAADRADPCSALPERLALASDTPVPGRNIADLAAVLQYKKTYRWPISPADLRVPRTYVVLRTLDDRHDIVSFTTPDLPDARGRTTVLGCDHEEFYRVDADTLRVLPFEGCIEGGGRNIPGLPRFNQLPH